MYYPQKFFAFTNQTFDVTRNLWRTMSLAVTVLFGIDFSADDTMTSVMS